ncbi:type II toxin-antitoxin system Phd/YefM family antitoxin [Myxococcota bacterium]
MSRFKAQCLQIVEAVRSKGREYLITKRGEVVARLVPVDRRGSSPFGAWNGRLKIKGDIVHNDWSDEFEVFRQ